MKVGDEQPGSGWNIAERCCIGKTSSPMSASLPAYWPRDASARRRKMCQPAPVALRFAEQYGNTTFPLLIDRSEELSQSYVVSRLYDPVATPTLFLISPDGTVAFVSAGFDKAGLNEISARIAAYLGVAAVEVAPADDGFPPFKPG